MKGINPLEHSKWRTVVTSSGFFERSLKYLVDLHMRGRDVDLNCWVLGYGASPFFNANGCPLAF